MTIKVDRFFKIYGLLSILVITVIFFALPTILQAQSQVHAQITGCGDQGDSGNSDGVGKYCTQGGGQCLGTGAAICSADIQSGPGLCSKPCSTNADCGTGAVCMASS